MTQLLPPKKEVALALLERSNVDVYLDPRAKGVVVPPQFRKEPRLILKIGLNMPVPIPDLRLDDESMSCTLSFSRSPFYCVVPWTSVFAMVGEDGRGMVWPDDVPQELAVKVVEPNEPGGREAPRAADSADRERPRRGGRATNRERLAGSPAPPRSTDEAPAVAADRPSRGGKSKKKKKEEVGRPVLVSVPSLPTSEREREARIEAAGDRHERSQAPDSRRPQPSQAPHSSRDRDGSEQRRDGVSAIPSSPSMPSSRPRQPVPPSARRPDGSIARPKRELPPYLRVVK